MADKLASLVVDLQLESVALREGLNKATDQLKSFGEQAKAQTREAGDGFTVLKGVITGLVLEGLSQLRSALSSCVTEFAEASKVERQLEYATGANAQAFKAQAAAMRDQLGVSDETIMRLQMLAARYDVNHSQIEKLTLAVLDYSAVTGKDAAESMTRLLNGIEAGGAGLKKMGIDYKTTHDSAKDLDIVVGQLADRWHGAAQVNAESFGGKLEKLQVQQKELGEEFGKFIAAIEEKTGIIDTLTTALAGARLQLEMGHDPDNTKMNERQEKLNDQKKIIENIGTVVKGLRKDLADAANGTGDYTGQTEQLNEMLGEQVKNLEAAKKKLREMQGLANVEGGRETGKTHGGDDKSHDVGRSSKTSTSWTDVADVEGFKRLWRERLKEEREFDDYVRRNNEWLADARLKDIKIEYDARRKAEQELQGLMINGRKSLAGITSASRGNVKETDFFEEMSKKISRSQFVFSESASLFAGGFKDVMKDAGSTIMNAVGSAAPKFGAAVGGLMQGFQKGGAWGAVIGAIASMLTVAPSFTRFAKTFEEAISVGIEALDPILKALIPLNNMSTKFLAVSMQFSGPAFERIGHVIFDMFHGIEYGFVSLVVSAGTWINDLIKSVSDIFYDIAASYDAVGLNFVGDVFRKQGDALGAQRVTTKKWEDRIKELEKETWENIGATKEDTEAKKDDADATKAVTEQVRKFGESLTNIPTGWRINEARYAAQGAGFSKGEMGSIIVYGRSQDQLVEMFMREARKQQFRTIGTPAP
jgi:hypothetical protein